MQIARCTSPREMLKYGLVDWHRHDHPTLSVVKRGSYVEHVLRGQYSLVRGLAVLSPPFTLHYDEIDRAGAKVLNWSLAGGGSMHGVFELPRFACRAEWPRHPSEVSAVLPDLKRAGEPIAQVAAKCGFADQSHMTRLVRLVTGVTPGQFQRRQITPVQDAQFPAAAS